MPGRTIVIMGGSDGIGAAAARSLAASGERVVIGRNPDRTRRVAAELNARHHIADFADLAEVSRVAAELRDECPRIDVLVNNAGAMATSFAADTKTNWRWAYNTPLRHLILSTPEKVARKLLWFLSDKPEAVWQPGLFYLNQKPNVPNPQADDDDLAAKLWDRSAELTGLRAA